MSGANLLLLEISGQRLTAEESARFRKLQPAGYLLTGRNLSSPGQTRELTDELRALSMDEPLIAIMQEGGGESPLAKIAPVPPSPAALAAQADLGKIADAGAVTGDLLRLLGINLNLAPTLNPGLHWGDDPQRVIDHAGQWNRWMRKRSMAGCAGRFPAGPASARSTLDDLLRGDVIPFTALMPEIDAVLISNGNFPNIDPEFPASLSTRIVGRFLRDQLGFDRHLVLTDNPDAKAAVGAGCDLVLVRHSAGKPEAATRALAEVSRWKIEEARDRLERFRRKKPHAPLKWSEESWRAACSKAGELCVCLPGLNVKTPE